jgi:ABC-type Fe3+-siderophore transport system permease subunit
MELQEFLQNYKHIIIIFHAIGAAIGLGAATLSDFTFFNFLKDKKVSKKESSVFHILTKTIWLALGILILSGIALFLSDPEYYKVSSKFMLKMGIVGILTLNGLIMTLYLHKNMIKLDFTRIENQLVKRISFASGAISIASWYFSFILGSIRKLPVSLNTGIISYICVISAGIIVSQIIYTRYQKKNPS